MQEMTRRDFMKATAVAGSALGLGLMASGGLFSSAEAYVHADMQGPFSTQMLRNKVEMPIFGFDTAFLQGDEGRETILSALQAGYKLIDTATDYGSEREVGEAIIASGMLREDVFITAKIRHNRNGDTNVENTLNASLAKLKTSYVDLYLLQFPFQGGGKEGLQRDIEVWREMEALYESGRVRAIGISNFYPQHLESFLPLCRVKPMVNQIELHPFYVQDRLIEICRHHKMAIQAYAPLARGKGMLLDPTIQKLANRHRKTPSQIMLRWSIQKGFVPLPHSTDVDRIKENIDVFNFSLSVNDMSLLNKLKKANKKVIPLKS